MNEPTQVRLRDFMNLVVGVIIVLTPFFNGDSVSTHGAVRLRFIACAIVVLSLWILMHQRSELAEWINAGLGAALISAPIWRHGVDAQRIETEIAGAIVVLFSLSCAIELRAPARRSPDTTVRVARNGRSS
jgi:hypothetical protein